MMKQKHILRLLTGLLAVLMLFASTACSEQDVTDLLQTILTETEGEAGSLSEFFEEAQSPEQAEEPSPEQASEPEQIEENGVYTSKDDVALYLHTYHKLPSNYITKRDAQALGWENAEGNLRDIAPGKSIGGDVFGNYEKLLPTASGRTWYECDIDYEGGYRNAKRIVYSDDGLIYYTEDHYETFTLLYEP